MIYLTAVITLFYNALNNDSMVNYPDGAYALLYDALRFTLAKHAKHKIQFNEKYTADLQLK